MSNDEKTNLKIVFSLSRMKTLLEIHQVELVEECMIIIAISAVVMRPNHCQ